ncbi:MAG TPA: NADH-quinone oxidoreductase subunit N [Verrucomicrobiae bacterium]|nr:NADH-quinone oxidoreductase subunit N [Verrucomicrobiae bacterium]
MNSPGYLEVLKLAMPETIVTLAALVLLFADLAGMRSVEHKWRRKVAASIAGMGCLGAIFWMFQVHERGTLPNGILVVDPLTQLVKQALLILTVLTAIISLDSDFTDHVGEYFALLLFATVGMMFLVGTENILMIFISLELVSLSLYILTAFNKRNIQSAEAALKYFLFGGMAAAFTLFGLSLIYGLSGSIELRPIAAALKGKGIDPLLAVAIIMTVIGFGFKIAAVPFHLWAPDAYQGAPTPSAALIASGSKVASFFILAKIMMLGFAGAEGSGTWRGFVPGWVPLLAVIAVFSMVLGNLVAIAQGNVKRLLAYSAIAHGGYALLGLLSNNPQGVSSLVYYVVTYGLTTIGAFAVVGAVENGGGEGRMSDFAGLSRRAPLLSLCMMIFMLSLAGIPPLAGFFGKFYVFAAAVGSEPKNLGMLWLVIFAVAMSAVSLYYYLQVLKQIYVAEPPANALPLPATAPFQVGVVLLALGVVVLGCSPHLLISRLAAAIQAVALH